MSHLLQPFFDWATSLDLSSVPLEILKRPVVWHLPDVLLHPTVFGSIDVFRIQQGAEHTDWAAPLQQLVYHVDYQQPTETAADYWLGRGLIDDERAIRVREFLWMAAHAAPPATNPTQRSTRFVLDSVSLLVQTAPRVTVGYHGGQWGTWKAPIDQVRGLAKQRYSKSPLWVLKEASMLKLEAEWSWADALWNWYEFHQPVPYALRQLLSTARLVTDGLVFEGGRLERKQTCANPS